LPLTGALLRIALPPLASSALVVVALAAFTPRARADGARPSPPPVQDEVQACIDASDRGQSLRIDKRLRAAKAEFAVCARRACPGEIREKCSAWLDETERAIPGVVFLVKDVAGADVDPVRITVDGLLVSASYDGSALPLDPGEHTFRFDAAGKAPLTKTLRLAQGERDRQEKIVLLGSAPEAASGEPGAAHSGSGEGLRTAALVGGGLGLAGIVAGSILGALAISANHRAQCAADNVCIDPQERRDAQGLATGSTVGFVAGGALLAGGVVLFLVAPHVALHPAARGGARFDLVPLASTRGAGALLEGAW